MIKSFLAGKVGIAAQLIIPFVVISVVTTAFLAAAFFSTMSHALFGSLEEKSQILTYNLAATLGDPLSMGEYDRMQQMLDAAQKSDPDLFYAAVLSSDGRAIAATDPAVKNERLVRDQFEKDALTATEFVRRPTPYPAIFEMVMPVKASGANAGVLRLGFSTRRVENVISEAEWLILGIGLLALCLGISVYIALIRRAIIAPIADVVNVATRISQGKLGDTVTTERRDEIGQLLKAMNDMVLYLREMACVADAIAGGILTVRVEARSKGDIFGNAFQSMIDSLNEQTRQLAAREVRFRSLCQTSPVGIFETDAAGLTTYANACWESLSGLSLSEMSGSLWYRAVHPDDREKVAQKWAEFTSVPGCDEYSSEFRIVRPSGEVSWVHCLSTGQRLAPGALTGYVGTIEDITKRKVSDMAQYGITAILSEKRSVDEAVPQILELACHTLDLDAAILWRVDETEDVLRKEYFWNGLSADASDQLPYVADSTCARSDGLAGLVWTIGRPMWMDRQHLKRNYPFRMILSGAGEQVKSAFACPVQVHDRTIGVMEFYSRATNELNMDLLDSYSSVAMQLGQFSERLEAELAATRLAAIVQCSEDAIISATAAGRIISWNRGAEHLFGYEEKEAVGKSVDLLLLDGNKEQFFDSVSAVLDDVAIAAFETVMLKRDHSCVDVSLTLSPVRGENGKIVGISLIARDITQRRASEERMREFYAIVSHELRTPLTSIRGALGLISGGITPADSEEGIELIDMAKSSSERLVRLINDMLDLKKIESGNLELKLQSICAGELIVRGIDAMAGLAQERGVQLVSDRRAQGVVIADTDRATQVLANLISNAIKYSEKGNPVSVILSASEDSRRLRFSVTDRGPGIAFALQKRLFGKFQQIDPSDSRAKEGTGLGLAISKAIVEQHGGVIGVNSAPGLGSTFWFELPLKAAAESKEAEPESGDMVLIVEDNQDLCSVLKVFLNREGYRCQFAHSLAEAHEKLADVKPDVLLLDVGLPDGNGLEIIEAARGSEDGEHANLPIIVITASERNMNMQYGASVIEWLVKPFDYDSLRRSLLAARKVRNGRDVLVVEDDDETRQIIVRELEILGVKCVAARDGLEALEKINGNHPDLIILDVSMPRADGFEVIARLRGKAHPPPPVLIYSGRDLGSQEKEQLRLGLTRYLTKGSVGREDFLACVKEMLCSALARNDNTCGGDGSEVMLPSAKAAGWG